MTLTERYAQEEATKQKAAAFDKMQQQAAMNNVARQGYEQGLADESMKYREFAKQGARGLMAQGIDPNTKYSPDIVDEVVREDNAMASRSMGLEPDSRMDYMQDTFGQRNISETPEGLAEMYRGR